MAPTADFWILVKSIDGVQPSDENWANLTRNCSSSSIKMNECSVVGETCSDNPTILALFTLVTVSGAPPSQKGVQRSESYILDCLQFSKSLACWYCHAVHTHWWIKASNVVTPSKVARQAILRNHPPWYVSSAASISNDTQNSIKRLSLAKTTKGIKTFMESLTLTWTSFIFNWHLDPLPVEIASEKGFYPVSGVIASTIRPFSIIFRYVWYRETSFVAI